jgi:ethanolamine utilization protein EutA (predicted chaperonin)
MRSLPMLLLAGALATACAPAATVPSAALTLHLTAPRQVVRVTNHNWNDMEVYAIRNGSRRTLGVVAAAQQATLLVSEDMLDTDGTLQLAARIQGRRDMIVMDPVHVPSGDYLDWSLENELGRSSVGYYPL